MRVCDGRGGGKGVKNNTVVIERAKAGAEAMGDPTLIKKGAHYVIALSKWFFAGCPERDDKATAKIALICHSNRCGKFKDGKCLVCGCQVSEEGIAIVNKARMGTESCPKGFWK
jgi:hypothetical protein